MMNNVLHPPGTSTRQLTWLPDCAEFVGEISDTNGFGRVYADACDEGLTLVSARTGQEVVFVVEHTERDADGDVLFWLLVPATRQARPMAVRLFND